jgi:hypothetical protein
MINSFTISQTPIKFISNEIFPTFDLDICFIYENSQEVYRVNIKPQEVTDITEFINTSNRPLAIVLDPLDKLYLHYKLDCYTLDYLKSDFSNIKSSATKSALLRNMYIMMLDLDLNPIHFISLCYNSLINEENIFIINEIIRLAIYTIKNYISTTCQTARYDQLFNIITNNLYSKPTCSGLKKNLVNYAIDIIDFNKDGENGNIRYLFRMFENDHESFINCLDYVKNS